MRASCNIVQGRFFGGDLEPGTFHGGKVEPGTFHSQRLPPEAPMPRRETAAASTRRQVTRPPLLPVDNGASLREPLIERD